MPADAAPVTPSTSPLIVISYSMEEEEWKDRLVSLFPTDVELRFVFNRVDDNPGRIDQETRSALSQSSVLVLLLSPSYLTRSWVSNEDGNWVEQRVASGGVKIVPVLMQDTSWEKISLLVNHTVWTSDGDKPIAEADNDVQSRALNFVVSRIVDEANLIQLEPASTSREESTVSTENSWELTSDVGNFKVSLEVRKTVGRAWTFVRLPGSGTEQITTELLLLALAEHGKDNPKPAKTPRFLWKELTRTKPATAKYNSLLKARFPEVQRVKEAIWNSHSMPPATKNTLGVFELAAQFSRETNKPVVSDNVSPIHDIGRIGARHLLAGLLILVSTDRPSGALHVLSELTDVYALRNRFLDFIVKSVPQDDHEAWRRILIFEPSAEEAKVSKKRESKVAEPTVEGNIEAPVNEIRQTVISERPFVTNLGETPSIAPSQSAASGSGSASTPFSPTETNFSELEAELSGTHRAQAQLNPDQPAISEDMEADATVDQGLDLKPILAGFATDYWDGRDLLDTTQDVNALASLVSAWSVEPPLSIGLFGDWGSGKSHFMRQMRKRVEKLSRKARNAKDKKQKDIGYYKNIVQIEFNAWHYIEGNLWASLVDHIFANLRVTEKEKLSAVQARRDQLMEKLEIKKEMESKLKTRIEERKTQLETKQREATDLAKKAADKKETASRELAGFRSEAEEQLNRLQVPLVFSEADKALLARLGIEPSELKTAGDYRKSYDELKGFWNRLRAQWKLLWTDAKERRRTFLAAILVLIPLAGALLLKLPQMIAIPNRVAAVLGAIATIVTAAVPTWNQIRKGRDALKENETAVNSELEKKKAELQGEVSALTKTIQDSETEADSMQNEISELEDKIENISTGTILAEFIEDRAAASDYRRHLGLLALIRRDFEKLRELFDQQRNEEKEGTETHDDKRINRIVLYIDDLDRCPPQRVVEVLQAIHLLLAFPIFVVVVGVDARWVTRSLQESYEWLRLDDGDGKKEEADADVDGQDVQGATPHDYLEKIFQIPFWLRPMEETQTKIFIDGLTEQVRYRPPEEELQEDEQSTNGKKTVDLPIQTDLVSGVTSQESAASGNGHPTQTVTDPVGEELPIAVSEDGGIAVINPLDIQKVATAESSVGAVDEKVTTETTGTPVTNIDSEPPNTDKSEDVAKLEDEGHAHEDEDEEEIDLAPHSLTLGDQEIEYMKSLAEFIGRSPRAVKRFLNCYRLIKVSLSPQQLEKFVQKGESYEYKAVMILLGIITGAPTASLLVTEEIENWKWDKTNRPTMADFHNQLEKNEDLRRQPDWARLKTFLSSFRATEESAELFAAFKRNTLKVSRYSFRIARAEAAGPKRAFTPQSKPSAASTSKVPAAPKAVR